MANKGVLPIGKYGMQVDGEIAWNELWDKVTTHNMKQY